MLRAAGTPPPRCSCAVVSPARPPLLSGLSSRFPRALRGPLRAPLPFHDPLCFFLERSPLAAHSLAERLRAAGQLDGFQTAASEMASPTPRLGAAWLSALRPARRAGTGPGSGASEGRAPTLRDRTGNARTTRRPAPTAGSRLSNLYLSPPAQSNCRRAAGGCRGSTAAPQLACPRQTSPSAPGERGGSASPQPARSYLPCYPELSRDLSPLRRTLAWLRAAGAFCSSPIHEGHLRSAPGAGTVARPPLAAAPRKPRTAPVPCGRYANRSANRVRRP